MGQLWSLLNEKDNHNKSQHRENESVFTAFLFSLWRIATSVYPSKTLPTNFKLSEHKAGFDLAQLPPELSLAILRNLNATDLYLAACVWWNLAADEMLWQSLCRTSWPFCSIYNTWSKVPGFSFRILYLRLDEARLTFNSDAFEGVRYLQHYNILNDDKDDLAAFLHSTPGLDCIQKRRFVETRPDVLDAIIKINSFRSSFLPVALRNIFIEIPTPESDPVNFIARVIERFSENFVACNPDIGLPSEVVYIICFSLIMLSKDFDCPQIKNKMSKREFIRNTRQAAQATDAEFLGHLYDNVYLEGNIAVGPTSLTANSVSSVSLQPPSLYHYDSSHARARSPNRPFQRVSIPGRI